ncbi:MAG TPA: hypothetical protein VEV44_09270, partial [Pseudoneobacillus sp.]|nr:hypothetical protein [Pseudoneobacillus sp.]
MKYFNYVVAMMLLVSLIINVKLLNHLESVENQLMNLANQQQEIISRVDGQAGEIRVVMDDIQKQQSWISEINMDINSQGLEKGETDVNFDWQIKEFTKDSKVTFHYNFGDQEEYTTIVPKETQTGFYKVEVPLNVAVVPRFEIHLMERSNDSGNSKQKIEEKLQEEYAQQSLKYFVSVTQDDIVKSSEIQTQYLGDFGSQSYGVINVDLDFQGEHNSIFVSNYEEGLIKKVELLQYQNKTLVDEEEMQSEGAHFSLNQVDPD